MIYIGTTNKLGQFTPHWRGPSLGITNYSNLGLALSALVQVAGLAPNPASDGTNGAFASLDNATGTITTYTLEQLNGVVEIREELGYQEYYENPLGQFLGDAADHAELMSQLPALLAGKQARVVEHDGWIFLYNLRPRGASKEE